MPPSRGPAAAPRLDVTGLALLSPAVALMLYGLAQVSGDGGFAHRGHARPLVAGAGLLMAPQGVGALLPRTLAGKLTDRIGPRPLVLAGMMVAAAGTALAVLPALMLPRRAAARDQSRAAGPGTAGG